MADGLWSGERFGEISSVPVGTVFGGGDFQRLGRQQMMLSGFFRPFVTPEWCVPGVGCYSLILNNDNGASHDRGDEITYVIAPFLQCIIVTFGQVRRLRRAAAGAEPHGAAVVQPRLGQRGQRLPSLEFPERKAG